MLPTLRNRQLVLINRVRAARVGDVVVAHHPETSRLIVKRLVNTEAGFWLEGDAHQNATAAASTDSWAFGAVPELVGVVVWPRVNRP